MENKEKLVNRTTDTLIREIESLSDEGLRDFFIFFYRLNHVQGPELQNPRFEKLLGEFDLNPFKENSDKKFRKQFIENIVAYTPDHMNLITAAMLIKRKFSIDEIVQNYYLNLDVFNNDEWYKISST